MNENNFLQESEMAEIFNWPGFADSRTDKPETSDGFTIEDSDRNEKDDEKQRDEDIISKAKSTESVNYHELVKSPENGDGLSGIAGMEDLKKEIMKKIILPLRESAKYHENGVNMPNGILFYGPAGCGKTYIAKHIAFELNMNYAIVAPSDLASTVWGGPQQMIAALFAEARLKAPCLLFLDEFEMLVPNRHLGASSTLSKMEEVDQMLNELNNCGERGVFVIAATNMPQMIDPAILRSGRLSDKIYIGLPDFETRKAVLLSNMIGRCIGSDIDVSRLASMTDGLITSDLVEIVNSVKKEAVYNNETVGEEMLEKAIRSWKPSVDEKAMNAYKNECLAFENKDALSQKKIGFVQGWMKRS